MFIFFKKKTYTFRRNTGNVYVLGQVRANVENAEQRNKNTKTVQLSSSARQAGRCGCVNYKRNSLFFFFLIYIDTHNTQLWKVLTGAQMVFHTFSKTQELIRHQNSRRVKLHSTLSSDTSYSSIFNSARERARHAQVRRRTCPYVSQARAVIAGSADGRKIKIDETNCKFASVNLSLTVCFPRPKTRVNWPHTLPR